MPYHFVRERVRIRYTLAFSLSGGIERTRSKALGRFGFWAFHFLGRKGAWEIRKCLSIGEEEAGDRIAFESWCGLVTRGGEGQ